MSKSDNRNIEDIYPLSPMQEGMLYHTLLDQDFELYSNQLAFTIQGELNIPAFRKAWQKVVDRHSVLRTLFIWKSRERPLQIVNRQVVLPIELKDWQGLSQSEQQQKFETFLEEDRRHRFDLSKAPLMRITIIKFGANTFKIVWSTHHLLLDGWSLPILLKEGLAFYEGFCGNHELNLEQPRPYRDYISWLRKQDLSKAEEFWRNYLKGFNSVVPLLVKHSIYGRSNQNGFEYCEQAIHLSANATDTLQTFARKHQLTVNAIVQGAWAILLHRYSGESDVVYGTTVSGRPSSIRGVESMVGLFINTLPFRATLAHDDSILQWLKKIQSNHVEIRQYEYTPLALIQRWSEVPRGTALFENILVFENYTIDSTLKHAIGDIEIKDIRSHQRTNYPLTIGVSLGRHLSFFVGYDRSQFEDCIISNVLKHLQNVLDEIVKNSDKKTSDLQIITEEERHLTLIEWNDTRRDYPEDKCIHQLFEEQAERTPENIAVVFEAQELTYKDLNERANQLANFLTDLGVRPEAFVGICLEYSLDMIISLLGIAKAGGAYVPLDPNYPKERLDFMLEDSNPKVVLTQERLLDRLSTNYAHVVCVDTQWNEIAKKSKRNPRNLVSHDNIAYLIYTSGSTGKPKGVLISHGSILSHCNTIKMYYDLKSNDRILQFASLNFDASLEEIFPTLIAGARLVVRGAEVWPPSDFYKKMQELGLTVVNLPSAYWQQLVQEWVSSPELTTNIQPRLFIVGGDVMRPEDLRLWHQTPFSSVRLLNAYGPTEATITATTYEIPINFTEKSFAARIPIGRPLHNRNVYILDKHKNPLPIGVPGELHIGGDGLARGYLKRPELSAEKFTPNPFSDEPGERLYKTGDLASYLPDGNIEFLGRIDHQVKIRGFRIETGEIETVLREHPYVNDAVVLAREDGSGEKHLIAYIVAHGEEESIVSELREFLKDKLPEYMVPSYFVTLDELPLTPSGKVDRKALPEPDKTRPELGKEFVAPRTPTEQILADIWAKVLDIEKVGVYDNFFELGGHSLLATQVVSRARDAFKVELPLRRLIEEPTVGALAEIIDEERKRGEALKAPPIVPIPREGELPLSFAQERLWFLDQFDPGSSAYNMPGAVRVRGRLGLEVLERSINEIIRRHESLRTIFKSVDGKPIQVIAPELSFTIPVIDLSELPEEQRESEAKRLAIEEAQKPFDLDSGPLLRATVLRLGEEDHVGLFTMHHIISDGWSIEILIREVAAIYDAYSHGRASPLPELPIQYADFAHWQRQWLQGEVLESQLGYWKGKLGDLPPVLELPIDKPRPAIQTFRGATQSFSLPLRLSDSLTELSRRENVTLFMTLLAAFNVFLSRYSGQVDIATGLPIAGRTHSDIEVLIGFFVNSLVIRTDLSGNPSFSELLARVRETTLEAYEYQDLPFEKLVEELQPKRDPSRTPLVQVAFAFQNLTEHSPELNETGLILSPFEIESGIAKTDLTLYMSELDHGLSGSLEYNTDLFDRSTITRMVGNFQTLLEGIVKDPDTRISDLDIMTKKEKSQLLVEWNNKKSDYTREKCIHELFEEQVGRSPESVAVVFEDEQLTYEELNEKADQLAHYLRSLGVKPDDVVGICLDRSIFMIIAILGILKSGGAYLPLDPRYPSERLAYMIEDSEVKVLLTKQGLLDSLPSNNQLHVFLDRDWEGISNNRKSNPVDVLTTENSAYVIYTSGSTGKPKGVLITHKNVVRLFEATRSWFHFDENDVWTLFHSYAFDFSVWEVLGALIYGGRLVVVPYNVTRSPRKFYELLGKEGVSVLNQTPSAFFQLMNIEQELISEFPDIWKELSLRLVIFGGEALEETKLGPWFEVHGYGQPLLVNMYGITETTVHVTYAPIKRKDHALGKVSRIGTPIPDTQVYLLDSSLQLVPIGVTGEMYVGGSGLARGYLNHPELTAERFIPNPFADEPGERLYRTGDLARYLPDGNLEFLGRIDHQVKIRGFRIETREIESALEEHPVVRDAVVIAREEEAGDSRLVAYVVSQEKLEHIVSELRNYLNRKLPEYMVPSAFVVLENLPLTPNGKLDRLSLPKPLSTRPNLEEAYVAPNTITEEVLERIFSQALGVEAIGVSDNFFELGGDSLRAIMTIARIKETFKTEFHESIFYDAPTVAALADFIDSNGAQDQPTAEHSIEPIVLPNSVGDANEPLLPKLKEMSEDEVDSMLYKLIEEENED